MSFLNFLEKLHERKFREARVQDLFLEDSEKVKSAVRSFAEEKEGGLAEEELLSIAKHWRHEDGYYPSLFAGITLGNMRSLRSIPLLLDMLEEDGDFLKEVAQEALIKIAGKYPDEIFELVSSFIEDHFDNDPNHARLFAYEAIKALAPREDAKQFLISCFEREDMWRDAIAMNLAAFGDKKVLHVLKRAIALAERTGDDMLGREARAAYCVLAEEPLNTEQHQEYEASDRESRKNWEERWQHLFRYLEENSVDDEEETEETPDMSEALEKIDALRGEDDFLNKMNEAVKARDNFPIAPFSLEEYLSVRPRGVEEEDFDRALRLTGLDALWTVEKVQKIMNEGGIPSMVLSWVRGKRTFPSEEAAEEFSKSFFELWNITPREELDGLTPEEMHEIGRIFPTGHVGRNDPCPCGSGKKFKKCHGQ